MNRESAIFIIGFLLVFSSPNITLIPVMSRVTESPSGYPVHNLSTGLDYSAIQEAIDAAETVNGNMIKADAGSYYEHIVVDKSVVLIGENNGLTTIDGNETGSVVQIIADDVQIANFTIKNAGKHWSGFGYPDSCVAGNGVTNVTIENNLFSEAAVSVWFSYSSFVTIDQNVVFNATSMGIVGYASLNLNVSNNLVQNCDLIGIHIDEGSINGTVTDNTVRNCVEGIELERSAGNLVDSNQLIGNNATVILNSNIGPNSLKRNNMISDWYNLIVWGFATEAFIQDIDASNTVNNKAAYYITNSDGLLITPSSFPNIGYLAVVNCTNVVVDGINLSLNRDGLLIANSTGCTVENIVVDGNNGPLLFGGLTFFMSNNNSVTNNRISNNSVGLCLYRSNYNAFFHNSFANNSVQVITNFVSPFVAPTGDVSTNRWDDGYPSGGNCWSDYDSDYYASDTMNGQYQNATGSDGIGDTRYPVNANPAIFPELVQFDYYPLMGMFNSYNVTYYTPAYEPRACNVTVISNSTISGFGTAIPWTEHPEVMYLRFEATGKDGSTGFCRVSFPTPLINGTYRVSVNGTEIPYNLLNCSNASMSYVYFNYTHSTEVIWIIPEFPFFIISPILVMSTLLAVTVYWKKHFWDGHLPDLDSQD